VTEPSIRQAPDQSLELRPGRVREVRHRDLAIRFVFGAATSVASALVSIAFGARAGGLLLAFPAILAASLTLIANEEARADAREDARGATVGAVALAAFAAVGAALFAVIAGGLTLIAATATWAVAAIGLYFLLWHRRSRR
jgi:Protein of unknown function (DUF3147)